MDTAVQFEDCFARDCDAFRIHSQSPAGAVPSGPRACDASHRAGGARRIGRIVEDVIREDQ